MDEEEHYNTYHKAWNHEIVINRPIPEEQLEWPEKHASSYVWGWVGLVFGIIVLLLLFLACFRDRKKMKENLKGRGKKSKCNGDGEFKKLGMVLKMSTHKVQPESLEKNNSGFDDYQQKNSCSSQYDSLDARKCIGRRLKFGQYTPQSLSPDHDNISSNLNFNEDLNLEDIETSFPDNHQFNFDHDNFYKLTRGESILSDPPQSRKESMID